MNLDEIRLWQTMRNLGFWYYFGSAFLVVMIFLCSFLLILDLFIHQVPFDLEDFIWWDVPICAVISFLFAGYSWYFGNKRFELKSNIIEMNLNENNDKKEK